MDRLTKGQRSELMSRIRGKGTGPEVALANLLRKFGFAPCVNPKGVIGNPDMVIGTDSKPIAVFVHGCFWHRCPQHFRLPKSRTEHWREHIRKNVARHARNARRLRREGFRVVVVWEHELPRKKKGPKLGVS